MRRRIPLLLSATLNLALAGGLFYSFYGARSPAPEDAPAPAIEAAERGAARTHTVVRRENFTWQQLESEDYHTFVANLREIGCPESIIRDIVLADVTALFERRKAVEIVTPEQQWWRSIPDPDVVASAAAQVRALETERDTLLADLLGPDWREPEVPKVDPVQFPLDGPVLGALPPETRSMLREIETEAYRNTRGYLTAQSAAGQAPDPAELARLRRETRHRLAEVLSPTELDEYLLRYSDHAHHLRGELKNVEVSPEEFRRLFKARETLDDELIHYAGRTDPAAERLKLDMVRQQEASLRQALGPERYGIYTLSQDPLFQQTRDSTEQIGASPELVLPLYLIRQATEEESRRLREDSTLTPQERAAALELVLSEQNASLRKLLGEETFERFREEVRP